MFNWISTRVSFKIVIAVIAVLVLIMVSSTFVIVERRADVLQQELLVKARTLAKTGAKAMEIILEDAMKSEQLTREELFDTDYKPITEGPLAGAEIPKYHTAYDEYLDERIRAYEDAFLESDDMVVFTVLVDKNGYLPTHNTKYSKPLTGDPDKDRVGNRTKRIFNDKTGLAAARYANEDGKGFLLQDYKRDTGVTMWDVSAPVFVDGEHWGGFRIGYSMELAEAAIKDLRQDFIIMMLSVLLIAGITTYLVVGRITRPLNVLTQTAEEIAEGNLEKQIEITSNDEVGQLARAFNKMTQVIVKNLQEEIEKSNRMVASIKEAVKQLSQSGKGLMEIANQQAAGATEQAAAVQQATTTSEEIAATAKQVAENAGRVAKLADHSSSASTAGQTAVSDAVDGMATLKQQVQSIAEAMLQLGENSQKIGGIIDIIDEISDQTNLLSLNAAIEAAGAGEAGKRFAIVANEVRRLADRTVDATNQVKNLIAQIQQATNSTIMLTEEGTKGVDSASEKVGNISQRLEEITQAVSETTAAVTEIELMTQQQTTASEQMADTVVEVRDVANQFAASTHETTQSLADLTTLAERLRDMVEEDMLAEIKLRAPQIAKELGEKFNGLVDSGLMPMEDLFDEDYQVIPGTDPKKYHTRYDSIFDEILQDFLDGQLNDEKIIYAIAVDRNGYVPTHNSRYSKPLTGDYQKDVTGNRTKRLFDDPVGLAAARFEGDDEHSTLQQVYDRDTGEKMLDVSAPIFVNGRHWGAFRIGYRVD